MSIFAKTLLGLTLASSALMLSACVSDGGDNNGRIKEIPTKTWTTTRTRNADGTWTTEKTVTEDVKVVDRGPAWEFQGNYWLKDSGDRECILFLGSAVVKPDWLLTRLSGACSNGMRNIGGWRLIGQDIALLDTSGNPIGFFRRDATFKRIFRGDIVITTGERFSASLQKDL